MNTTADDVVGVSSCGTCGKAHWLLECDKRRQLFCVRRCELGATRYPLFDASDMSEASISRLFEAIAEERYVAPAGDDPHAHRAAWQAADALLQSRWDALEVKRRPVRGTRAWQDIRTALVFGGAVFEHYSLSHLQRAHVFRLAALVRQLGVPVVFSAGSRRGSFRGVLVDARGLPLDLPLGASGRTLRQRLINRVNLSLV